MHWMFIDFFFLPQIFLYASLSLFEYRIKGAFIDNGFPPVSEVCFVISASVWSLDLQEWIGTRDKKGMLINIS